MTLISAKLEESVELILNGEGLEVREFDSVPEQMKAATRKDVCFAVCAVIFNSKDEILMVQEGKRDCEGLWYLPAGRMEEGETIPEAVEREVKEEAGIDCKPITLLQIQEQGPKWVRFVFLAEHTGGSVKTLQQKDAESLQADWFDREALPRLRRKDIITLIDAGMKYKQNPWFTKLQPVNLSCDVVCQRLLLTFSSYGNPDNTEDERLWLLLSNRKTDDGASLHLQLPVAVSIETQTVTCTANRLVQECMPSIFDQLSVNTCGILGVQHHGTLPGKTDGLCFNTLVLLEYAEEDIDDSSPPNLENDNYRWYEVTNQSLREKILQRIREGSVVPVHSHYT